MDGMVSYASCYGGHQFGGWAGQLGDGRALSLGELVHGDNSYELQLKEPVQLHIRAWVMGGLCCALLFVNFYVQRRCTI